jgi:RNA polymerase sigma factor (sigma-70 family)
VFPSELLERRDEFVAFLRRRLPSAADAEDALQQAFLAAARSGASIRRDEAAVAWFYSVLRSTVADHFRAESRQARLVAHTWETEPTSSLPPHELGTCACSLALLPDLPPAYQQLLTRVDVQEEPLAAVASELGLTLNNATVRLHRARKALREGLAACCGCKSSRECLSCKCASGCV